MEFRLRLMPVAIAATIGLLALKLGDVWVSLDTVVPARAQSEAPAAKSTPPSKPGAPQASPPAAQAKAADSKLAAASAASPAGAAQAVDPLSMSPSEVELLQKLSARRAELDKRASEISQREVLLQAAEKRIDDKIAKLQSLEKDIGGIVDKKSEEEQARIKSLVKIYETMKPRDAARIFEQLDMPVLLDVVENMKERSAAPILAAMDPGKAKAVTLALAERRDQRAESSGSASPTQPASAKN